MTNYCFTDVVDGDQFRIAKITENESGYNPLGKMNKNDPHELDKFVFDTKKEARIVVDNMNSHLGVDEDREWEIKFSTMINDDGTLKQ